MTGDTFRQRHAERAIQRGGNLVAIVRIDDQGAGQLLRRPGKLRQDQYARVIRILRRDVLLRHQVHTIA